MSKHRKPIVLGMAVMLASSVLASDYRLSSEAIREAYFIGNRRDKSTADFLEQYTRHFSAPRKGPDVAMIQLETPFARIVEHSEQTLSYNAPDAVQDFLRRTPEFRLRIQIYFTPSYSAIIGSSHGKTIMRADDFWREFKIELTQGTQEIHPERSTGNRLLGSGDVDHPAQWIGAEVQLYYPATAVHSGPARVEVLGPEGSETRASFDFASLR
jgi:hypothetical protein